jgi:hypothetical protein
MKALTLTAAAFALAAGPLFAQDAPKSEADRIKDLEKKVEMLSQELDSQKKKDAQAPAPDTAKTRELERKVEILSQQVEAQQTGSATPVAGETGSYGMGAGASKVYSAKNGLSVGGYGETIYTHTDSKTMPDGTALPSGATADALRAVVYVGYKFNDRIVLNSEFEWEHGGYSDRSTDGEAILEFSYLDFLVNKSFNVRAGLLLMPMGFVNELHEPPARLGNRRPFVENEGGIIPTTWREDGVGIHGDLGHGLEYRLYVVNGLDGFGRDANHGFNGEGISGAVQLGKQAQAKKAALTGRLEWTVVPGVSMGTSFYTGDSNQGGNDTVAYSGPALTTDIVELHAEYRAYGFQFRGLYAQTTISKSGVEALPVGSAAKEVGTRQFGGYLEAGYDILSRADAGQSVIPFVRWERLNTQAEVASGVLADPANDRKYLTVGVNYKPIPVVVVKADFTQVDNHAGTGQNQFNLGIGYTF